MKRCPTCGQTYDDTQSFCANDGTRLETGELASSYDPMATIMAPPPSTGEIRPPATYGDPTPPPPASWATPSDPWTPPSTPASPGSWSPPPPPGSPAYGGPMTGTSNGLAIGSLVCGIIGICFLGIVLGPVAMVMGFLALSKAKSNPAQYGGKGMAIGGIVAGLLALLLNIILFIVFLAGGGFRF